MWRAAATAPRGIRLTFVRALLSGLMRGHDTLLGALKGRVGVGEPPLKSLLRTGGGAQFGEKLGLALGQSPPSGGKIGSMFVLRLIGRRNGLLHPEFEGVAGTSDLGNFEGRSRSLLRKHVLEGGGGRELVLFMCPRAPDATVPAARR